MNTNQELLKEIRAIREQIESRKIRIRSIIYFLIGAAGMTFLMKVFGF